MLYICGPYFFLGLALWVRNLLRGHELEGWNKHGNNNDDGDNAYMQGCVDG